MVITHALVQDSEREVPIIKKGQPTSSEEEKCSTGKRVEIRIYYVNKGSVAI